MRSKICVIGSAPFPETDVADVVGEEAIAGADVVVLGPGADVEQGARLAASRASGAAVLVVGGDVRAALGASLLPRGRVFGVAEDDLRAAAEAVVLDRRQTITVEMVGLDDELGRVPASVGAGGIRELR